MSPAGPRRRRSPWQAVASAAHRLRRRWYRQRARSLPRPVVSVGNLHWGGTGKTPVTLALAAALREEGWQVCILSRGYRRRSRGPLVVGRGDGPEVAVALAGDEPHLMARELAGVAVVVAERRLEAGRLALEVLDPVPELFLLDDGFSHLALRRELDLLVLPADDPLGGEALAPGGRLREPPEAVARADAALLVGDGGGLEPAVVVARLAAWGFAGPLFRVATTAGEPRDEVGQPVPPGRRLLLVTGIARDERVAAALTAQGRQPIAHLAYPDHHAYPAASVAEIERRAAAAGADLVVTTGKDLAKLAGRLALPLAVVPHRAQLPPDLLPWLLRRLPRRGAG